MDLHYVILHHTGIAEPHYDLLFESSPGSELMSARLAEWPPAEGVVPVRVPPHRRLYLTYEGPVSGGRGQVRRVASGLCSAEVDREDSLLLTLDSGVVMRIPRAKYD